MRELYLEDEGSKDAEGLKKREKRLKNGAERLQGDERLKHYGLDGCPPLRPEGGFFAVHVYGSF